MFPVLFPVSLSWLHTPRDDLGMSFRRGEHKIRTKSQFAKRFTGDIEEKKDKKCKNGRVPSLLYHISKLTIPFLCPHKILSSSYAMFVLLYPLYYLYLTNCNTLVRNNEKSLFITLFNCFAYVQAWARQVDKTATPLPAAWERGVSTPKDRLRSSGQSSFVRD